MTAAERRPQGTARLGGTPNPRRILGELAAACRQDALLWRGAGLSGRDVDVLVDSTDLRHVTRALLQHGMVPSDPRSPWGAWIHPDAAVPPLDLLGRHRWPQRYQDLDGVLRRVVRQAPAPTVAPEDLLLILASDAVAGRDLAKVRDRVDRVLLSDPGARSRAADLAACEGIGGLWQAITDPVLARSDRSGRLRLLDAARIGLGCRPGRRALLDRTYGRAVKRWSRTVTDLRPATRAQGRDAFLVALSGMDGAGKSTLAAALSQHLHREEGEATINWSRLGGEERTLRLLGGPVKRLLRRTGTIADPVVVAGPAVGKHQHPRAAAGGGAVERVWTVVVALVTARTHRRRAEPRRRGMHVVCDRWTTDALVDLELRYGGRHPLAETVLKWLSPEPDLALLLEVDTATAASRKPHDKAPSTLRDMRRAYAARARDLSLLSLDASQPPEEVLRQATLLVDRLSGRRQRPSMRSVALPELGVLGELRHDR